MSMLHKLACPKKELISKRLSVNVIQQSMRVARRIVLPLLTKAHNEFGFFEGIVRSAKTIRQITRMILHAYQFYW